uniref:Uncharacterized protein n=1 Tax=Meloidogyne incognita TaxID=6306 RepID=A0A914MZC5_MELIC
MNFLILLSLLFNAALGGNPLIKLSGSITQDIQKVINSCSSVIICYDISAKGNLKTNARFAIKSNTSKEKICKESNAWRGIEVKQVDGSLHIKADVYPSSYIMKLKSVGTLDFLKFLKGGKEYAKKIYDASIIDKEYINLMKNNQDPLLSEFPGAFMLKIDMIAGNGDSWISSVCEKVPTTTVTNAKRYQRRKIVPTTTPTTLKTTTTPATLRTTSTTTTIMTTTKGKHCELKSSPSDFNLYGCHCSSLWNNTDIDHDVRAPVDDVDRVASNLQPLGQL